MSSYFIVSEGENGETVTTPYVEPLARRIETTRQGGDDIDTNRRFLAIMDHPDNLDIVRQVDMILAINDPEPVDEDEVAAAKVAKALDDDGLVGA